jgi:dephospho-CoA kinase
MSGRAGGRSTSMVVGLIGRYCAGKDSVARVFAAAGFAVIDGDHLGHQALVDLAPEVIGAFGAVVAGSDGKVDRKALGRLVFSDQAALRRLESIVHPSMAARARAIASTAATDVLINAAVLQRMGLLALCDAVVFVIAPLPIRICRAVRRDQLSLGDALARASSQRDIRPQFDDRAVDTYIVRNAGSARSLERRVLRLIQRLRG